MARIFGTPIVLPADPTLSGHASNKNYIDTGLATKQSLDSDLTTIAALAPADGTFMRRTSGAWTGAVLTAADMPLVLGTAPGATSVTTSVTPNASAGSILNYSCTTATLAIGVPTSPADRQVLRIAVVRSTAAQVVVTFNASIVLSTGLASSAYTVPSGKVLLAAVEYSAMITAWVLTAATVSA